MRAIIGAALLGLAGLAGCAGGGGGEGELRRALRDVEEAGDAGLTELMMAAAPPDEALGYFSRALLASPGRIELERGRADALVRGGRVTEGLAAWEAVAAHPDATPDDRVELAGALVRTGEWERARAVLATVPPTHETFERLRLEAIVADAEGDWARADSFYATAVGLTTTPAGVLNNWGYSQLTRGDYAAAERLLQDALRHDPQLFTAKNNLVLARAAQRTYQLPVVPMTQEERARLLHTMGLAAVKQNDVAMGRSLLREAMETHPRHFEEAARALEALEGA